MRGRDDQKVRTRSTTPFPKTPTSTLMKTLLLLQALMLLCLVLVADMGADAAKSRKKTDTSKKGSSKDKKASAGTMGNKMDEESWSMKAKQSTRGPRGHGPRGKRGARFGSHGGGVQLCLDDADKCERMIMMKLAALYEVDADGKKVNWANKFTDGDFEWSKPVVENVNGVNRTRVQFDSKLSIAKNDSTATAATFTMITHVYHEDGTAMNGEQELQVKKGSLKFAVNISNWHWMNSTNSLKFGILAAVRTKKGIREYEKGLTKKERKAKGGDVERFDLGEGGVLDSPNGCVVDGVQGSVNATTTAKGRGVYVEWTFPHFKSNLYYDPIVDEDEKSDDEPAPAINAASGMMPSVLSFLTLSLWMM